MAVAVGLNPPVGANSLTVTVREMPRGATNTPNNTGPLGVTEKTQVAVLERLHIRFV